MTEHKFLVGDIVEFKKERYNSGWKDTLGLELNKKYKVKSLYCTNRDPCVCLDKVEGETYDKKFNPNCPNRTNASCEFYLELYDLDEKLKKLFKGNDD